MSRLPVASAVRRRASMAAASSAMKVPGAPLAATSGGRPGLQMESWPLSRSTSFTAVVVLPEPSMPMIAARHMPPLYSLDHNKDGGIVLALAE